MTQQEREGLKAVLLIMGIVIPCMFAYDFRWHIFYGVRRVVKFVVALVSALLR